MGEIVHNISYNKNTPNNRKRQKELAAHQNAKTNHL